MISNFETYSSGTVSHFEWENYTFPYKLPSVLVLHLSAEDLNRVISAEVIKNSNVIK